MNSELLSLYNVHCAASQLSMSYIYRPDELKQRRIYFVLFIKIDITKPRRPDSVVKMSDPTIQTFCCHHTGNKEDFAVRIMQEFNTDSYNATCLVSSTVGILGSIYQVSGYNTTVTTEEFNTFFCLVGTKLPVVNTHLCIWLSCSE